MTVMPHQLATSLLYNFLCVFLAAVVVQVLIRWMRPNSPRIQQAAWFLVLLPSCLLFDVRYPVEIVSHWNRDSENQTSLAPAPEGEQKDSILHSDETSAFLADAFDSQRSSMPEFQATVDAASMFDGDSTTIAPIQKRDDWQPRESTDVRAELPIDTKAPLIASIAFSPISSTGAIVSSMEIQGLSNFVIERWPMLVVGIWIVGIVMLAVRFSLQFVAFQYAIRDAIPARREYQKQWQLLLASQQVNRVIHLLEHSNFGPMLTITPRGLSVVIPSDYWEELSREQRLSILRHELAHYQRNDIVWSLVAQLLVGLQWFNPMAWYTLKRFDECVEWGCDAKLAEDSSIRLTDYAQALVRLLEFPVTSPMASRAARGSSISNRIRKLLSLNSAQDSKMKQYSIASVLLVLLATSFVRVELVANQQSSNSDSEQQPTSKTDGSASDSETVVDATENKDESKSEESMMSEREQAIADFLARLQPRDQDKELIQRFLEAVPTPAGLVVMASTVYDHENSLRDAAQAESSIAFVSEIFEKSGDKYVLKKEYADFPARFEKACRVFEQDTAAVAVLLKDYGNRMSTTKEVDQLVKRFLIDDNSPSQVYLDHVQDIVRPDYRVIRNLWQEIFVLDQNNHLVIRSGAKRAAEQLAKNLAKTKLVADRLQRESTEWRQDLSESNPVSKAVREAMGEPLHNTLFAVESMSEDYPIEQRINNYFDYVEEMFIDKADGLVPADERVDEVKEKLREYAAVKTITKKLQPHLLTMSNQIVGDSPLTKQWKELLQSDAAAVWTINYLGSTATDVETVIKDWFEEWLIDDSSGKLTVRAEQEEDKLNATREWLRNARAFRRKGLDIVEFGKKIDNPTLATAYQTTAGKCLVMRSLQDRLSRQYFDGFGAWVEENFDASDDGYTLKEGREWALTNILDRIESIKQELANDDF